MKDEKNITDFVHNNMLYACEHVAKFLSILKSKITVNMLELDINDLCIEYANKYNLKLGALGYHGYPAALCVSTNNIVCHGIPRKYKIQNGDIVSVDVVFEYNGYYGDSCYTYKIGKVNNRREFVTNVAYENMWNTIELIKPGISIYDLGLCMQEHAAKNGLWTIRDFAGHGIGTSMHLAPSIPFYAVSKYKNVILKAGDCITIEPMLIEYNYNIKILRDGWTAVAQDLDQNSAQFEHTVLVTYDGFHVLSYNDMDKQNNKPQFSSKIS